MPHDVFVSYSSQDKAVADAAVMAFEADGIRCWYAPRDVEPGHDWAESIADAIAASRVFVLVFSADSNRSQRVLDEVNLAINEEAAIIPFRIERLDPSGAMLLHLSTRHWLDAYAPSWEVHLDDLVSGVRSALSSVGRGIGGGLFATPRRRSWGLLVAGLALAAAIVGAWAVASGEEPDPTTLAAAPTTSSTTTSSTTTSSTSTTTTVAPGPAIGSIENPLIWGYTDPTQFEFAQVNEIAQETVTRFLEEYPEYSVRVEPAVSREALIATLCDGDAHVGSLGPFSYIAAAEQGCATARLIWSSYGDIDFAGITVVREGSGFESLSDLEGEKLCIPSLDSISGWVLPSIQIMAEIGDPVSFFDEIVESGSHDDVLRDVLGGECAAGNVYFDARVTAGVPGAEALAVISSTEVVPLQNVSFAEDVPDDLVAAFSDFLISVSQESADLAQVADILSVEDPPQLVDINDHYYDELRSLLESAGVSAGAYLDLDL